MSKVRADQFPNYQTVSNYSSRLDSKKKPLAFQLRCVCSQLNATYRPQKIYRNIENLTNSNVELPL
jgi:hypothetical protein